MTPALPDQVQEALTAPLVDQHCRAVRRDPLTRSQFETLLTATGMPAPSGTTHFDGPLGLAVRRWCAPLLDLDPHAPPAVYLARRTELGSEEVNRRLLRAARVVAFLLDSPDGDPGLLSVPETGRLGGAAADEVICLERVEEEIAAGAPLALDYLDQLERELATRATRCVALSSTIAYRHGLDFDPARPSRGLVLAAAGRRLTDPKDPLTDPILLRHLLWIGIDAARERALPVQFLCGLGAPAPHLGDPGRMSPFIRALLPLGLPVILLHCHPFHHQAAYLAAAFPHVYVDTGGTPSGIADLLNLAPYHKYLYGSSGTAAAESCFLAALNHRMTLSHVLSARLTDGTWSIGDAARVAHMIGSGNARRVYRL
ncbi:amidohydrolase family protein [Acrocarpospora catenulata]|uniref:amidohydrolase family protein n=1 Tax=Acrocarpospora catenulata TaxID=2836182 RepID=UPI001BDAF49C|nr:amidohydrolase family protein [Acrocarpospora catenulata]